MKIFSRWLLAVCLVLSACSSTRTKSSDERQTSSASQRLEENAADGGDAAPPTSVPPTTSVSLTFDDTLADQYAARALLAEHGMHATFYTISNRIGFDGNSMTLAQMQGLAADGNEIAGHTLSHP